MSEKKKLSELKKHPNCILNVGRSNFTDTRGEVHALMDFTSETFDIEFKKDGSFNGRFGAEPLCYGAPQNMEFMSGNQVSHSAGDRLESTERIFLLGTRVQVHGGNNAWWDARLELSVSQKVFMNVPLSAILQPTHMPDSVYELFDQQQDALQREDTFPLGSRLPVDLRGLERWDLTLHRNGYDGDVRVLMDRWWKRPVA